MPRKTTATKPVSGAAKAGEARPPRGKKTGSPARGARRGDLALHLPGARLGALPARPEAQLATLATAPPAGDDWLHELKFDGYRMLARVSEGRARLWTRNGNDWTERFPTLVEAVESVLETTGVLDGEVVIQKADGTTSFQSLQNLRTGPAHGNLLYYVFDILHLEGVDLSRVGQEERKVLVQRLVARAPSGSLLRYSDHVVGAGAAFFAQACAAGVEGIISKRRGAPYRPGRTRDWVKVKCTQEQEFIVVGFTEPAGSRQGLGALLVGVNTAAGIRFSGRVGTGFSADTLRSLRRRLGTLERRSPPVVNPPRGAAVRDVHWVEPTLVAQVSFTEVTDEGILRHPSFKGLREDKSAAEVVLERPADSAPAAPGPTATPGAATRKRSAQRASPQPAAVRIGRSGKPETEVGGVRLSSPDKVYYREDGYTKLDVARYYEAVADWILPHLADRPLTLVRCPQGYEGQCFFQKHMDEVDSPHVHKVRVKESRAARDYGTIRTLPGLITVVQLGALELHSWNSRSDRLEQPDRVTFDIDPDEGVSWADVVRAALEIRLLLRELELESFVKTTGGKGLHVVVPLVRRADWDDVKEFSRVVLATVAGASPGRYTLQLSKAQRKGRLLLDYLRNARGATAVEVYSTRARRGATVSTPVGWDELEAGIDPRAFHIGTVPDRLRQGADPWNDYGAVRQSLTAPLKKRLGIGR